MILYSAHSEKPETATNAAPLRDWWVENFRIDKRTRMNWKILLLPKNRTRTAFNSNFDNRHMKPPIFAKKTEKLLNGPPFETATQFMVRDRCL